MPRPGNKNQIGCFSGGCLILVVLAVIGAIVGGNSGNSSSSNSPAVSTPSTPAPPREDEAAKHVEITKWSWRKGGFDNIMFATFTFKNNNDFAVKDITVQCVHSAASGTTIDDNTRTIYKRIAAHKKLTVHDFDMGFIHSQAERSNCTVKSVVPE
jgi:hypothetical protein